MANRNRSYSARREAAKRQSLLVESFNDFENRRERERFHSAALPNPVIHSRLPFYATLPILGFLHWFKISNHYVELSRHTETHTTMTAVVCSRMGTPSEAYV